MVIMYSLLPLFSLCYLNRVRRYYAMTCYASCCSIRFYAFLLFALHHLLPVALLHINDCYLRWIKQYRVDCNYIYVTTNEK